MCVCFFSIFFFAYFTRNSGVREGDESFEGCATLVIVAVRNDVAAAAVVVVDCRKSSMTMTSLVLRAKSGTRTTLNIREFCFCSPLSNYHNRYRIRNYYRY